MRYLAIDPGQKRTGLAVGSDVTGIAHPLRVIQTASADERMRQIGLAIGEHGADALVLGLPRNMDGSEGPAAREARHLARQLTAKFGLPVHFADERLSSFAADEAMSQSGLTHGQKKSRRDALAAAVILREFLESLANNAPGDVDPEAPEQ